MLDTGPPMPWRLEYLWRWFGELEQDRESGMGGLGPIRHVDILAWAFLRRIDVRPHEVRALKMLDMVTRFPGERKD